MRGPHSQSHVTLQYCGHVTNKKHYISTFTRPMDSKLNNVMTQDDGTPSTKSRGTSSAWSCDKQKTLYFYIKKVHVLQDLTRRLKMRGLHPKDHVIVRSCSHVKIQKRHIFSTTRPMAPKLSRMGTQIDGTSCTKQNNTSFSWSCYIFTFTWPMLRIVRGKAA